MHANAHHTYTHTPLYFFFLFFLSFFFIEHVEDFFFFALKYLKTSSKLWLAGFLYLSPFFSCMKNVIFFSGAMRAKQVKAKLNESDHQQQRWPILRFFFLSRRVFLSVCVWCLVDPFFVMLLLLLLLVSYQVGSLKNKFYCVALLLLLLLFIDFDDHRGCCCCL